MNPGDRLIIKLRLPHTEWEGEEVDYVSASVPVSYTHLVGVTTLNMPMWLNSIRLTMSIADRALVTNQLPGVVDKDIQ